MYPKNRQSGAVLLVALILLTITTFVGFSSMETSLLENKMATSRMLSEQVFQAAETAIEEVIDDQGYLSTAYTQWLAGGTDWPAKTHSYSAEDAHDNDLQTTTTVQCLGEGPGYGGTADSDPDGSGSQRGVIYYSIQATASRQGTNPGSTHEQGISYRR